MTYSQCAFFRRILKAYSLGLIYKSNFALRTAIEKNSKKLKKSIDSVN